jgi:DNA helicase II / ATP-dependent DNA helicase PcrA
MSNDILSNLNAQQKEAVEATEGPILIVAGPGSGKTRVLTHKVAYLIRENHIPPENLICVTFTNKAAQEMRERVRKVLGVDITVPWISTYHSTCAKILRRDGYKIGLEPSFTIYDDADSKTALTQIMRKLDIPDQKIKPSSVLYAIASAKNELIDEKEYQRYAQGYFQDTVAQIFPHYQKLLSKNNAVDFGDLIFKAVELLKTNPDTAKKYQNNFHYVLVDEYQDTNHAQYILTKLLADVHHNLCVVGDVNQAIYSWRGADFRNILQFEKDFPTAKVFRLERNYRSTQTVLQAASKVIAKSRHHLHLELWTDNEQGEPISIFEASNEQEEAEYIAIKINDHLNQGPLGDSVENLNNFAVLYRTNAQSRILEETFIKHGLPYRIVGGIRFYERKEIKDVLAYLRLLINPDDSVSKERVEKLGKRRLERFSLFRTDLLLEEFTVIEILDNLLSKTHYLELYDRHTEENEQRKENVKELRSVASQFNTLEEFLENVALVQQERPGEDSSEAVTFMTLHSAKGLEFDHVFIIGLEEGLFPHSRALVSQDELEEERRLCYVGMTRAKKKLHLTYARNRFYFGVRQYGTVSRFLEDIPTELIQAHYSSRLYSTY